MNDIQARGATRITPRLLLRGALVTAAVAAARPVLAQQMQTHLPPDIFADPSFPAPRVSIYDSRRHPWVHLPPGTKAFDKDPT